eukprot:TRINITY_DN767_c0_g1_i1.p1 TRINITY_DN767_c0_g1~~TRINITY_DN767_c0_g1_i1.p1  ORF type:complete len:278 (+),score=73.57 TRINITY_DN767_c0_g1_i1:141-974(+)
MERHSYSGLLPHWICNKDVFHSDLMQKNPFLTKVECCALATHFVHQVRRLCHALRMDRHRTWGAGVLTLRLCRRCSFKDRRWLALCASVVYIASKCLDFRIDPELLVATAKKRFTGDPVMERLDVKYIMELEPLVLFALNFDVMMDDPFLPITWHADVMASLSLSSSSSYGETTVEETRRNQEILEFALTIADDSTVTNAALFFPSIDLARGCFLMSIGKHGKPEDLSKWMAKFDQQQQERAINVANALKDAYKTLSEWESQEMFETVERKWKEMQA